MDERSKARWMLVSLIGFIVIFSSAVLILVSSDKNTNEITQQADIWAAKDNEVIEIVKRCKIPGSKINILQFMIGYLERAKIQGNLIEFEGWYAFQVKDSLYEAGAGYKINGLTKTAKWDVDLSKRKVNSRNQQAFIFSGNNDVLNF